jgi:hypothetical protein
MVIGGFVVFASSSMQKQRPPGVAMRELVFFSSSLAAIRMAGWLYYAGGALKCAFTL